MKANRLWLPALLAFSLPLCALLTACGGARETAAPTQAPVATAAPTPAPAVAAFTVEETPTPEPMLTQTPSPTPQPEGFSVVWIADSQYISEMYPETLSGMMRWAVDNREAYNIQLVVHTGDIVNDAASRRQWNNAKDAFSLLSGQLPFVAVAGNHDVGTDAIDYKEFQRNIGALMPADERGYQSGRGNYTAVEAAGAKFLFIGVGWAYKDSAVAWLNQTIANFPGYTAVLCLHSYLNENATRTDGGDIIFEQVIAKNRSVRFVLCGHRNNEAYLKSDIDDNGDGQSDRAVHQLLYNYQELKADEGGGFFRILTFYPATGALSVTTYSAHLDQVLETEAATFTIKNAF